MLLTVDAFREFEENGFLLLDNNSKTSSMLLNLRFDPIEIDKGVFPNPIYFIEPRNRHQVITSIVYLLKKIRTQHELPYFYDFGVFVKAERLKISLTIEDEGLGTLPLPLLQSLEILDHEKIIFTVRKNSRSFIGFDIFVSKYDEIPDKIRIYSTEGNAYNVIVNKPKQKKKGDSVCK
jgi:hypothetical protein